MGVLALLALALAKPYLPSQAGVTAQDRLPQAVVLVVDTGFSMGHKPWWQKAQRRLDEQLDRLRPWDEVALVTSTGEGPVRVGLVADHQEVRRAMQELAAAQGASDMGRALEAASGLLSASSLPNRRIVVVSDFGQSMAQAMPAAPAAPLSAGRIELISVRDGAPQPANLAITSLEYEQQGTHQDQSWRIDATVQNFGAEEARGQRVELLIDGQSVAVAQVDVAPGQSAVQSFRHRLEGQGLRQAVVQLVDADPLEADNRRVAAISLRERVQVLLVNGKPSPVPQADALFFLMRALSPAADASSAIVPVATTAEALEGKDLGPFDVVVLANVARLSDNAAARLKAYVEGGGGLFIAAGDQIDPETYNRQLGPLLPRPLHGVKLLAEREDPDAPVKVTRMGQTRREHPIFRVFSVPGGNSLPSTRVYSYMLLEPGPPGADSQILLSYQDDAPALVERRVGAGRVMLMTTSVDRHWTDLPIRTAFLPLMHRTMSYLARRTNSGNEVRHLVGQRLRLELESAAQERVVVRTPQDTRLVLEPEQAEVSFVPQQAGFYAVDLGEPPPESASQGGKAYNRDAAVHAVNVDPRLSDLRPMAEGAMSAWTRLDQNGASAARVAGLDDTERRVNLWPPLLFAVTIFLLLESMLGVRRSVLATFWQRLRMPGRSQSGEVT